MTTNVFHPNPFSLAGRRALVIGGGGGIGTAVVQAMRLAGAEVAIADRRAEESLDSHGALPVDVTSDASVANLAATVAQQHEGLDFVVNCFGINGHSSLADMPTNQWARILDVNLTGVMRVARELHGLLAKSQVPAFVILSSTASFIPILNNAHYAVSKAGLNHLTRCLANEWSGNKIRVNAVAPTIVPTAMNSDIRDDEAYLSQKISTIPFRRMVEPSEVANIIVFLCSPAAAMITGQILPVDGGVSVSAGR